MRWISLVPSKMVKILAVRAVYAGQRLADPVVSARIQHALSEINSGALGIAVADGPVAAVESHAGKLTGVRLADGTRVALDALAVAPRLWANAELVEPLGLEPAEVRIGGHVIGTQIEADRAGATSVPGIWVAGNVADIQAQVITAAAAGLAAGAAINADLIAADARRAAAAGQPGEQGQAEAAR